VSLFHRRCGGSLITAAIMHQGSCYPHTVEEIPLLIALATHDDLAGIHRTNLLGQVFAAASAGLANLPARADVLAARGLDLTETDDERSVRQAVERHLPELWQRWDRESEGTRLALAYLAAVFPEHAAPLTDGIQELHGIWPATSRAEGLTLCLALATNDDAAANAAIDRISDWIHTTLLRAGSPLAPTHARGLALLEDLLFQ
jgi:hypothetical protein